jgi:hypothetical protein
LLLFGFPLQRLRHWGWSTASRTCSHCHCPCFWTRPGTE